MRQVWEPEDLRAAWTLVEAHWELVRVPAEQLDACDWSGRSITYRRRQPPVYEREPFQQPSPVHDNASADS